MLNPKITLHISLYGSTFSQMLGGRERLLAKETTTEDVGHTVHRYHISHLGYILGKTMKLNELPGFIINNYRDYDFSFSHKESSSGGRTLITIQANQLSFGQRQSVEICFEPQLQVDFVHMDLKDSEQFEIVCPSTKLRKLLLKELLVLQATYQEDTKEA